MPHRSPGVRILRRAVPPLFSLAGPLLRLFGPPPRDDRGVPLDPHTRALLAVSRFLQPFSATRDVSRMRREFEWQLPLLDVPPEPLARVEDRLVPGSETPLRVRTYEPGDRDPKHPRPLCVYYHGGGFVLGSLESHDGICRYLAKHADVVVVAVDYRRAPEHRFPAAVKDAIAAFRWAAAHGADLGADPDRVAVAGDSAGGNLAAVVAWHERQEPRRPRFQLLVYPVTDFTHSTESYRIFARGFLLEAEAMTFFRRQYLVEEERDVASPMTSVIRAPDLRGTAPGYVALAGFDPLRDEGERYAMRLREAGVEVEIAREDGLVHGFFSMGGAIPAARRAIDRAVDALARGVRAR